MKTAREPTLQVNVCVNCFPIVEKYQDPKEIMRQLMKKGCSRCKLIAFGRYQQAKGKQ